MGLTRMLAVVLIGVGCGVGAWWFVTQATRSTLPPAGGARTSDVIATVGGYDITRRHLAWEVDFASLTLREEDTATISSPELQRQLLTQIIERKLLFRYIQQDRSFTTADSSLYGPCIEEFNATIATLRDPEALSSEQAGWLKERLCEQAVIERYLEQRIYPRVSITDEDIEAYFQKHRERYARPHQVVIRQIVLPDEQRARRIRYRLNQENFADMAREHSIAPEAPKGGLLGPFSRDQLPPVFDVAFDMKPGQIKGILKSTYGFHVIMLEREIPAETMSLEEARPLVLRDLRRAKQEDQYAEWIELALGAVEVSASTEAW